MRREDLVSFLQRRQRPQIRIVLVILSLFLGGVLLSAAGVLDKIHPGWPAELVIPAIAALAAVALVALAMKRLAWSSSTSSLKVGLPSSVSVVSPSPRRTQGGSQRVNRSAPESATRSPEHTYSVADS